MWEDAADPLPRCCRCGEPGLRFFDGVCFGCLHARGRLADEAREMLGRVVKTKARRALARGVLSRLRRLAAGTGPRG